LHLVIQPTGAKSWALRFRGSDGRHVKMTLGPVDLSGAVGGTPVRGRPLTLTGEWTIPGTRTKNHRAHTLPLPAPAMELIASVTPVSPHYVFSTNGRTAVSGFSKVKVQLDREIAKIAGGLSRDGGCTTYGARRRLAWPNSALTST
jgi:hypothetical protein